MGEWKYTGLAQNLLSSDIDNIIFHVVKNLYLQWQPIQGSVSTITRICSNFSLSYANYTSFFELFKNHLSDVNYAGHNEDEVQYSPGIANNEPQNYQGEIEVHNSDLDDGNFFIMRQMKLGS